MNNSKRKATTVKRVSLLIGAAAVIGMGGITAGCSPKGEKPAETNTPSPTASVSPTEKGVRTNVTRSPMVATPGGGQGGNAAVPCGFGPQGGAPCSNRN